jgi:hypothetical protein
VAFMKAARSAAFLDESFFIALNKFSFFDIEDAAEFSLTDHRY